MKGAEGFPAHVVAMLGENLVHCLGQAKEERHEFQVKVSGMVHEVLNSIQAKLEASIAAAESKVAQADTEKASREALAEAAKDTAASKAAAATAAKEAVDAAVAELKSAQEALQSAQKEQKNGDLAFAAADDKKVRMQSIITTVIVPCKEGATGEAGVISKGIAEVTKLGKEYGFDAALMSSLPSALNKAPADRGSFDQLVVTQVETELQNRLAALTKELEEAAPAREERAAKVTAATATVEVASSKEASCKEALKAAQTEHKEADSAVKTTAKAVKQFGAEMKQVGADLAEAKESLDEFLQGAMATFKELLEQTNVVPEEPAKDAAAAPAEAAEQA